MSPQTSLTVLEKFREKALESLKEEEQIARWFIEHELEDHIDLLAWLYKARARGLDLNSLFKDL